MISPVGAIRAKASNVRCISREKKRGSGRATRVCLPDILVTREDTRTIELIVEVDLTTNLVPKKLVGLLLTPALADYYTPSLQYGAHNSYRLRETVIVSVTALTAAQRGQDLSEAIYRKFRLYDLGVRHISVCNGATEGDIETKFARLIQTQFGITRARSE